MCHELILKILFAALCGYIYSAELTKPDMILNSFYNWLQRTLDGLMMDQCTGKPKYIVPADFFFKPLIGCFRCVCGQWTMWTYFVQTIIYHASNFNLLHMIAAGLCGVGISILTNKILSEHE